MNNKTSLQKTLITLKWCWGIMTLRPGGLFTVIAFFQLAALCDIFTPLLIRNFLASFEGDFILMDTALSAIILIA